MSYREELIKFISEGKNESYRKIKNNTYAVKTRDISGNEVVGIQLHRTIIFAALANGDYQFNNGGWNTMTTNSRLTDALNAIGIEGFVTSRKKIPTVFLRGEWDNPYVTFDKVFILSSDLTIKNGAFPVHILPNQNVSNLCAKNSKGWY